ncbi:uncharacterized protein LOC136087926 [Hydra vulgaris]|uniref:Uncharacterized protein LOC136087926 n=1 Tax=Hydra vulgaris TaxID=6087 RepID=A0ABM4D078_HYDVU
MSREYQRKTIGTYDHKLMTAIQFIKERESVYSVSKSSEIPYGTLYRRSHDQIQRNDKRIGSGCGFVLNNTEENLIIEALMYLADKGFPQDREDIKLMVKSYKTFTGKKLHSKMKSQRKTSACVLKKDGIPHCIFSLDETGLRTNPTAGQIFVRKTSKTVYYVVPSCGKSMYTVLFCGSANGQCLPPFVVYKAIHLYDAWCQNGPENAMYVVTKSGWRVDYIFESWIDRFIIHVKDYAKPVLLLCDRHSSHINYFTVKKALYNHKILLCLPPNTSHALQPLDVGVFAPLKSHWKKILKNWRAIDSVLTLSPSQPTLTALANSKKRRVRVQTKKREILTAQDVVARLQEKEKNKAEKKAVSVSKRKLLDITNIV